MDIMRCTKSFRGVRSGCATGELIPAAHPMVKKFPQFFEPVSDFVSRKYPQYASAPETEQKPAPAKKTTARKPAARKES